MKTKKIFLYSLHILKNHFLTTVIFIAFMYLYFSVFRGVTSQLISGIFICLLYFYGNFSSGRFHAKKRDALSLLEGAVAITIASLPTIVLAILATNYVSLNDKGFLNTHWANVAYRLWNSPFIGVYSYADEIAKSKHSVNVIITTYWITTLFLPVSSLIGYSIGVLEKKELIKLPEYTFLPKKKSQNKKQSKTGKSY
ncbi:hypothetical protein B0S90_1441 [Caldicellulosiruptor bescii]|uniref:Uncharacterized protein n=2 Tax=Caldicellulosiruptor bescii TaxID=31899 RepID=B9MRE4_CALBD|nr:hypothetical protein [Caldicellulosiruptor bescii]ACM60248.1 conserved hypothetical protein [Caldicellulosiruptor bescii DSM 6725]PBC87663.1 hypothetical protein B0S87_0581 [Caldicellulosiruptor bescii]PBC90596.1 hypothetical protein B0S89_0943 [Caldicellulosiruptor bescii]PBD03972.1 hypothetical protein B0S85_1598 [Caldicellulosiruptor bescii]PBD06393.1 hypothetical protein B0S90_1441 [Caldicellulosiruptor bescii]